MEKIENIDVRLGQVCDIIQGFIYDILCVEGGYHGVNQRVMIMRDAGWEKK